MAETLNKVDSYLNRITEGKTLDLPDNVIDLGGQPDGERKYSFDKDAPNSMYKDKELIEGADYYFSGNINDQIQNLQSEYKDMDIFIIGGSEIINLTFKSIEQFYLTRIYGNYNCEKFIDITSIENNMKMINKINGDSTCHFEIWER